MTDAAKVAEERGWKLSIEEMTIKTKALKDAGIKVLPPSARAQGRPCQDRRHDRHRMGEIRRCRRRRHAGGVPEIATPAHCAYMRRALDTLYRAALWASALCLVAIALMVGAQLRHA